MGRGWLQAALLAALAAVAAGWGPASRVPIAGVASRSRVAVRASSTFGDASASSPSSTFGSEDTSSTSAATGASDDTSSTSATTEATDDTASTSAATGASDDPPAVVSAAASDDAGTDSDSGEGAVSSTSEEDEPPTTESDDLPVEGSVGQHVVVKDEFLPAEQARSLREVFEERFADPRNTESGNFCWNHWFVYGQYNLMRTPAEQYFSEEAYAQLCEALTAFAQEELGCDGISPPWLSYYVDGHSQGLHTDAWHGPFAFVLSLTEWEERQFEGGETMLLSRAVLDFWRAFEPGESLEESTIFDEIEPHFNRLTVFDPRIPHGVREVRGTRDPAQARLVLHGWFTASESVSFRGGLSDEQAGPALDKALEPLYEELSGECARMLGVLHMRMRVSGSTGAVEDVRVLADTLVPDRAELVGSDAGDSAQGVAAAEAKLRAEVIAAVEKKLSAAEFPRADNGEETLIFVPFSFV